MTTISEDHSAAGKDALDLVTAGLPSMAKDYP
jgi:hypothetical protein